MRHVCRKQCAVEAEHRRSCMGSSNATAGLGGQDASSTQGGLCREERHWVPRRFPERLKIKSLKSLSSWTSVLLAQEKLSASKFFHSE